jgi:hypothetical protein
LHRCAPDQLAAVWALDDAREIDPDPRVDGGEIRALWREAKG